MKCILCEKETNEIIRTELRDGTKRNVYMCRTCNLGLLDAKQTEAELKAYYATEYRGIGKPSLTTTSNAEELFNAYQEFQGDRLRLLKSTFGKKKNLLELGCSSGMFLYHAKNNVGRVVGVDYDSTSAEFAAKKTGATVYNKPIRETTEPKASFDTVVAFQTLEHVGDPHDFVEQMKEYTKKGGTISIEVPNLDDSLVHIYNLPHHEKFFYHKSHLWYFTPKSLLKLMNAHGIKGKIHHIQDYNIINHMNWIINDAPQPNNMPGLRAPVLPLRTSASPAVKKALSKFITKTDADYKKLLAKFGVTSNILFIGKKS